MPEGREQYVIGVDVGAPSGRPADRGAAPSGRPADRAVLA